MLDLGAGLPPWAATILRECHERIVVTDAGQNTLQHTRILLGEMEALGIAPEDVRVVLNHRVRFDTQFPVTEAEQGLGHSISVTLRPAPELMMAAARRHLPGVLAMPEDSVAEQILKMADGLLRIDGSCTITKRPWRPAGKRQQDAHKAGKVDEAWLKSRPNAWTATAA